MKNPKQADRVCEVAYGLAMMVYVAVGLCGYLMYGNDVSDEVSRDLVRTGPPLLAKIAVWMVALNPLTKIALGIRPVSCYSCFTTLFSQSSPSSPLTHPFRCTSLLLPAQRSC